MCIRTVVEGSAIILLHRERRSVTNRLNSRRGLFKLPQQSVGGCTWNKACPSPGALPPDPPEINHHNPRLKRHHHAAVLSVTSQPVFFFFFICLFVFRQLEACNCFACLSSSLNDYIAGVAGDLLRQKEERRQRSAKCEDHACNGTGRVSDGAWSISDEAQKA